MQELYNVSYNVSKDRQGKRKDRPNSGRDPNGYLCVVCGGERYHLVLTAEALNNRVGLKIRCGTCNASQDMIDSAQAPRHGVLYEEALRLKKPRPGESTGVSNG